jgi:hypothetical protein
MSEKEDSYGDVDPKTVDAARKFARDECAVIRSPLSADENQTHLETFQREKRKLRGHCEASFIAGFYFALGKPFDDAVDVPVVKREF